LCVLRALRAFCVWCLLPVLSVLRAFCMHCV